MLSIFIQLFFIKHTVKCHTFLHCMSQIKDHFRVTTPNVAIATAFTRDKQQSSRLETMTYFVGHGSLRGLC